VFGRGAPPAVVSGEAERWDAGWVAKDLLDAVYGSLIGGAIGDALGAPDRPLWHHADIRRESGAS
jgi:hypothetical protein